MHFHDRTPIGIAAPRLADIRSQEHRKGDSVGVWFRKRHGISVCPARRPVLENEGICSGEIPPSEAAGKDCVMNVQLTSQAALSWSRPLAGKIALVTGSTS